MFMPAHFAETDIATMHALMRARPFATLVTHGAQGLTANHLPMLLVDGPTAHGCLNGHVARANPLLQDVAGGVDALVVFQGPDLYISPSNYATKAQTGRVVPTWNYAVVHAHGRLRTIDDAAWLARHVEALTTSQEAGQPTPWAVADAPAEFTAKLIGAVVGLEIEIIRLEGKWKASQNQPAANKASVIAALEARGDADSAAMAELVRSRAGN